MYEGATARLADFGQRIGTGAINRPSNIGGDGENAASFGQKSRVPSSTSQRFAVGMNFAITPYLNLSLEAKYIEENTFDISQPTFFDINLVNSYATTGTAIVRSGSQFDLRWQDNAFLPANVKAAIAANTVTNYLAPTLTAPGVVNPLTSGAAPYARHSMWGPDRTQDNDRTLQRYVFDINGNLGDLAFIKNINWDLSYVYGIAEMANREDGIDTHRFTLAADAVIDAGGVVNGRPGEIVCRGRLLQAQGLPVFDNNWGGNIGTNGVASSVTALNQCVPLNVFGAGNQSQEALDYIAAHITVHERNEQEQAIAFISGELWDFFGAGPIGVAVGGEYRREGTEAVGRDRDTGDRWLFLNTGPDFPYVEYESEELFAELSIPLFRDSWLGEYAEISGSYRYFDYTYAGHGDVYGVNFVYRPIKDIAFKASYNTSFRAPNLGENFSPQTETYANAFTDPCATNQIVNQSAEIRARRVSNCNALLVLQGRPVGFYDFNGDTVTNSDDYAPNYSSGISGVAGGNPLLQPETSESLTFSTVIEPRFFPNFSLVLDYYEITINDVIATPSLNSLAAQCIDGGASLSAICDGAGVDLIWRDATDTWDGVSADATSRSTGFMVGGAGGAPGFVLASLNFAKLQTRGLDFTARYSLDTEEAFGKNWGRFDYSIRGLWLIEQKNFTDPSSPLIFSDLTTSTTYPRVRFSSSLTWTPNDTFSVNWTADWQASQDSLMIRDMVQSGNLDSRLPEYMSTGDFTRHDFTVRINVNDQLSLRTGVVNAFDAEQPAYLGQTLVDSMDPYGTRFFFGLNYRPW